MVAERKKEAEILSSYYSNGKRMSEITSVTLFVILLVLNSVKILKELKLEDTWIIVAANILAMLLADLFSGLVHWGADTWGNLDSPFVGKTFIRSFREHHLDPLRITQHDWIETNGDNCLICVGPLFLLFLLPIRSDNKGDIFLITFLGLICIWVSLTNQFHKWAHMHKPPTLVRILQDYHIILSRKNHSIHHHNPFDRNYCITTGWLNPLLGSIGFWKQMEDTIEVVTGAVPREDDAFWTQDKSIKQEQS